MTDQKYFNELEVEEIIDEIVSLPIESLQVGSEAKTREITGYRGVKAAYALNLVRILRDRLGLKQILETLYTDETLLPRPLVRLIRGYIEGLHSRTETESILDELQTDMRKYYSAHNISFIDPNNLPKEIILDLSNIPGFENSTKHRKSTIESIKKNLELAIQEYSTGLNASQKAKEIFERAHQNIFGEFDTSAVVEDLTKIIVRQSYTQLMINIGTRNPTPQELANSYLIALERSYQRLGLSAGIDSQKVLEERMQEETYQGELKAYRESIARFLIY